MRLVCVVGAVLVGWAMAGSALAAFRGADGMLVVVPASGHGVVLESSAGRVLGSVCRSGPACGDVPVSGARWSSDGRALVVSLAATPLTLGRVVVVYADGSCLDCYEALGGAGAFTPDSAVLSVVGGGVVRQFGVDGLAWGRVASGRVSDAVWSSSGELALVRAGAIWAGRPGRLVRVAAGGGPSWSPDGSRLVFVHAGWVIVEGLATRRERRVARGRAAAWSPDGGAIALIDARGRVWIGPASGGGRFRRIGGVRARAVDWQPRPRVGSASCLRVPGSVTVAQSASAIVTEHGTTQPFTVTPPAAVMGCVVATGKVRLLASYSFESEDQETGATAFATAGNYAALGTFSTDLHYGGSSTTLEVYDIRTGAIVPGLGGETAMCQGDSCETTIDDPVINTSGASAARVSVNTGVLSTPDCEQVQASDSTGVRTLDQAPCTYPPTLTNLALNGDTLTWQHAGAQESSQLH